MKLFRKISAGLLAVTCLFTLAACQNNQQRQASNQKRVSQASDESLPTDNYINSDNQQQIEGKQRKRALSSVTSQMNKNYKQIGSVKNSNNTLTLSLNGSQMQEMVQEAQQGNSQATKFWNELTTGFNKTSKTLSHQLRDQSLTLKIMSPNNNLIYSVSNGSVNVNKIK